jgi:hypothetical protein
MNEPQINFIKPKCFSINLPGVGAPVAIGAECDEIIILVRLALRPRDNVMNINLDVSTGRDGASVPSLDENTSTDVSRYWRTVIHDGVASLPNGPN